MNAPPGTVVMHQNVSIIQAIVASALDFSRPSATRSSTPTRTSRRTCTCGRAAAPRGRDRRGRRATTASACRPSALLAAIDEQHADRPDQPRAVQELLPAGRARRSARARARSARWCCSTPTSRSAPCRSTCRRWASTCSAAARSSGCAAAPAPATCTCARTCCERSSRASPAGRRTPRRSPSSPDRSATPRASTRLLHGSPAVPALLRRRRAGYETVLEVGVEAIRAHSVRADRGPARGPARARLRGAQPGRPRAARRHADRRPARGRGRPGLRARRSSARGILVDHRPGAGRARQPALLHARGRARASSPRR